MPGLAWGELCRECRAERTRRAAGVARRVALAATTAVGLYVALVTPPVPLIRVYGIVAILATYLLVRQIVHRVAMELLPR
ncbi:MAG: hypothetical protein OEW17_03310 [Gemmatimonadota bacterium]|nr:hypothetical protein [Gemmatimonadota bacterium]MDH4347808.1 hypothetical protein [Gemmatimonadota bacterium]MDH5282377.1 hypothetical protein [Gemmatimonadota bacterium]